MLGVPVVSLFLMMLLAMCCFFQGRVCDIPNKQDNQDFQALIKALKMIGLSDDQLMSTWAVVAGILQLGNICFTSFEV